MQRVQHWKAQALGLLFNDARDQWGIWAPLWSSSSMLVPWWKWKGNPPSQCVEWFAQSWVTMADTWPLAQTLCSAWPIPCLLFTRMILLRWLSGVSRIIPFPSLQMVYWFISCSCGIVPSTNTWRIGTMGAFSFLGECIFFLTSFHRSLFLTITRLHTVIPRQERMLHLSPLVPSRVRAHCSICYITTMVFGVYHGVRTFFHVYFSWFKGVSITWI